MIDKKLYQFLLSVFFLLLLAGCKDYDSILEEGEMKLDLQYYTAAIKDFDACIKLNDKKEAAYHLRGCAYFYLKDFNKAKEDFMTALSLDYSCSNLHYSMAKLLIEEKKYSEAINNIQYAINIKDKPKNEEDLSYLYVKLGWCYLEMHNFEEAKRNFELAISDNNYNSDGYCGKGIAIYKSVSPSNINDSNIYQPILSNFNIAISLNHKNAEAYYFRALLHLDIDQKSDAIADLKKSVKYGSEEARSKLKSLGYN